MQLGLASIPTVREAPTLLTREGTGGVGGCASRRSGQMKPVVLPTARRWPGFITSVANTACGP